VTLAIQWRELARADLRAIVQYMVGLQPVDNNAHALSDANRVKC
jgi:hypothetical protein